MKSTKLNWEEIWDKKASEHNNGDFSLSEIMRVNGYDVAYAKTGTAAIRNYVNLLIKKLKLEEGNTLLEVGCGAGAIAMPMIEAGINVTGFDPSKDLISIAKKAMPENTFYVADGASFLMDNKKFDGALSQGVFQFFSSEEYGMKTVLNMLDHVKDGGIIAITDLLDSTKKETLMRERVALLGEEEFQKKYVSTGLDHQFYTKSLFEETVKSKCQKFWFEDQFLDNPTAKYKFNFYVQK